MSDSKFLKVIMSIVSAIGAWFYKYIGGLFMEVKNDGKLVISFGRVMLLGAFLTMIWFWLLKSVPEGVKPEMPDMLFETFCVLCGYVFGTKVTSALTTKWGNGADKPEPGGP